MARYALSALLAVASTTYVAAQVPTFPATPLASEHFAYPTGIPYQAMPETILRGTQSGYNICNSTTENQDSLCQTSFVDHIDDFCLWAPSKPNSTIADTEGEEVAWCTKKGHGTRLMPEGTLYGVQYLKAPDYILIVGFIDQTKINIQAGDFGGELDPHGQDLAGNPMGGLLYSNAFPSNNGNNATFQQVIEWTNFMGGNQFCIKACDPAGPNPAGLCQHTLDRIGCAYNAPSAPTNGTFEVCDSDNMDVPGIYTVNGQTLSYSQPAESLGPITTVPYTPRIPASSNCVTFTSSALYTDLATVTAVAQGTSAPPSSATPASGSTRPTSGTGASTTPSRSGSGGVAQTTDSPGNGAGSLSVSLVASVVGVVFSVAFLA